MAAAIETDCRITRRTHIDNIRVAIQEIGRPTKARRLELLQAALNAQAEGIYFDSLEALLEKDVWDAIDAAVLEMNSENNWLARLETISNLTNLISRNAIKFGIRAFTAVKTLHAAFHVYIGSLFEREYVHAFVYTRDFDGLIKTTSTIFQMITDESMSHTAFNWLMCLVRTNEQGKAGVMQRPFDSRAPDIPLAACIEDIFVFLPDGDQADVYIHIKRDDLLSTSFAAVMAISKKKWAECETMDVCFNGESGYGEGVVREWIGLLATEIFYGTKYFTPCPDNPGIVHPAVCENDEDKKWMEFAGRIIGLAIKVGIHTGVYLSQASLLIMTMRNVGLRELAEVEPSIFKSCNAVMDATTDADVKEMSLDGFRTVHGDDMFPGSGAIEVKHYNRVAYAELVASRLLRRSELANMIMLQGILYVLHSDKIHTAFIALMRMSPAAINDLIGGAGTNTDISPDEWRMHTSVETTGDPLEGRPSVDAFFTMVGEMTPKDRRLLLRFWTGMHTLPTNGFAGLPGNMRLVLDPVSPVGRLPSAHTCIMSMLLPCNGGLPAMRKGFETALAAMEMNE